MPQELKQAIAQIVMQRDLDSLKSLLEQDSANAKDIVACFRDIHRVQPASKALNLLDQVLLLNHGQYVAYENALKSCAITRILPGDVDTTRAPDKEVISTIKYMIDGAIPTDRTGKTLHMRFSTANVHMPEVAMEQHRSDDRARFFAILAQKMQQVPGLKA